MTRSPGRVQRVGVTAALALVLEPRPDREIEQGSEAGLQSRVALDLAAVLAEGSEIRRSTPAA